MKNTLHITSGDSAGDSLGKSGVSGEVFVWHDVLYDGIRNSGWPTEITIAQRIEFLSTLTGGGLAKEEIADTLQKQYRKLRKAKEYDQIVLWFDACLFDQTMLAHILACLATVGHSNVQLLCIDRYPGVEPYHGLGQLSPQQLAVSYPSKEYVSENHYVFAKKVDEAFAVQDVQKLQDLAQLEDAPLPWVPAAVTRWLAEKPDPKTGLGKLESLAYEAIRNGLQKPVEIFKYVSTHDSPPQYWGDITLWQKINGLAEKDRPLVHIEGPGNRLPQWKPEKKLSSYSIRIPDAERVGR